MDLLLFDLDGTLVDSKRDIVTNVNRALAAHGLPIHAEANIAKCIGKGIHNLFGLLLGEAAPIILIDKLVQSFRDFYSRNLTEHTTIYDGIVEMLEFYAAKPKIVLTNKSQAAADGVIEQLGLRKHFVAVFGPEAFTVMKPDPRPILQICEKWKAPLDRTVLVGDSTVDVTCGKRAGIKTVFVRWGYGDPQMVRSLLPDYEVARATDLMHEPLLGFLSPK